VKNSFGIISLFIWWNLPYLLLAINIEQEHQMYSTPVFFYHQRQIVVIASGTSPRRFMPQFSKTLTLHRGVDNQIQFKFVNQEQKGINLTGKSITCRIISDDGTAILLSKTLELQWAATGIAALLVSADDLVDVSAQRCHYSLEIPDGSFNYPVFVDGSAGARGKIDILDSVLPSHILSNSVSIPTGQMLPNVNPLANVNTPAITYYSSTIHGGAQRLTIQAHLADYTGNIIVQGSSDGATWYPIDDHHYASTTDTIGTTVSGVHPEIRVGFVSNCGSVTNLLSR
jgi:hypothetical protein